MTEYTGVEQKWIALRRLDMMYRIPNHGQYRGFPSVASDYNECNRYSDVLPCKKYVYIDDIIPNL